MEETGPEQQVRYEKGQAGPKSRKPGEVSRKRGSWLR